MSPIGINILIVIVVVGFGFFVVSKIRKEMREQQETWSKFAENNGYQYTLYNISGDFKGLSFTIERYDHQSNTGINAIGSLINRYKDKVYSIIKFHIPDFPKDLQVYLRENITQCKPISLSTQDNHPIETGDTEFDEYIVVRGEDNDEVIQYLNVNRRALLKRLFSYREDTSIQPYGLHLTEPSTLVDLDELKTVHTQLGNFAVEFYRGE
jgi:hypothetical protein